MRWRPPVEGIICTTDAAHTGGLAAQLTLFEQIQMSAVNIGVTAVCFFIQCGRCYI